MLQPKKPVKKTESTVIKPVPKKDKYKSLGGEIGRPTGPKTGRVKTTMGDGKTVAKNGKSFPDLNKDGKVTRADILKGRGVIAKKGASIKKAQGGIKVVPRNLNDRQIKRVEKIGETNPERARKVGRRISDRRNARGAETSVKPMMKSGGKMKTCKGGC